MKWRVNHRELRGSQGGAKGVPEKKSHVIVPKEII
jgi:hypothetical protein